MTGDSVSIRLREITDVLGMSSTFAYGADNAITNIVTPYGRTSFEYFGDTNTINSISRRAIRITEPNGEHAARVCDAVPGPTAAGSRPR